MKLYFEFDCLDIFAKPVWQSPSIRYFISWKAPEDRCYSATRGEIFILKFAKYLLVAGLRPDPLGEGRGGGGWKYQFLLPQPKNRSRAYGIQ